ncbi:uncharacterized protein JCM6883_003241 [Sporobolomyces salmoneus]|uniref:uncharacterized protein n=1 Tax=Sporobolomyces salmoneus TaxID=183962 RepID=UPI003180143F
MQSIENDVTVREDPAKACRGDVNEEDSRTVAATAHPRRGGGGANPEALPDHPNYSDDTLPSTSPVSNDKMDGIELLSDGNSRDEAEDGVDPLSSSTPLPDCSISEDTVEHTVLDPLQNPNLKGLLAWYLALAVTDQDALCLHIQEMNDRMKADEAARGKSRR